MMLLIDQGNTYCKWQLRSEDAVIREGRVENTLVSSKLYREVAPFLRPLHSIHRILVSNVAGQQQEECLRRAVSTFSQNNMVFVRVLKQFAGVSVAYRDIDTLGVDRWLALLAAHNKERAACMILSAGTALTLDVIDVNGVHLGGYIAPGLPMLTRVISQAADIDVRVAIDSESKSLGKTTEECVKFGVLHQFTSFFRCAMMEFAGHVSCTILTGGDAELVYRCLSRDGLTRNMDIVVNTALVMEGLYFYHQFVAQE